MATIKISKRNVDALKPGSKETIFWDAELGGFGVRCRASGSKVYVLKYRHLGRQRWITIGQHGAPWTPELARKEAKRLLGETVAGRDPASTRDREKLALTLNELIDRFLVDHVQAKLKARTAIEYRRIIERFVRPNLGKYRPVAIGRSEIAELHHRLKATPRQANRKRPMSTALDGSEFIGPVSSSTAPGRRGG